MEFYEVSFLYDEAEGPFEIGLFSSREAAAVTITELREAPGFCDTPEGFYLVRRPFPGDDCPAEVYEALIEFHTFDYALDHGERLGLFRTREEADEALRQYQTDNPQTIPGLIVERLVNRYVIDQPSWREGFTHESPDSAENIPEIHVSFGFDRADHGDFDRAAVTKALGIEPSVSRGAVVMENGYVKPARWYVKLPDMTAWLIEEPLAKLEALLSGRQAAVLELQRTHGLQCGVSLAVYCTLNDRPALSFPPESIAFWGSMNASVDIDMYIDP